VNGWDLAIVGAVIVLFAVVSRRLDGSVVSPAMVFVAGGLLFGNDGLGLFTVLPDDIDVRRFAEITLALVLFTDASALDTGVLRREAAMPTRLLAIGLPLTIIVGTVLALPVFPQLGLFEALALAVLLAPTDAALGQTVVSDERIPSRIRQGLSVESGLNDGICVPLLFAAIAMAELQEAPSLDREIIIDLVKEVGIAGIVGAVVAVAVVLLTRASQERGWISDQWIQVVPLAAVAVAYPATVELGGSGFIAAFVAGLVYGRLFSRASETVLLIEETGDVLSAATFFLFGAVVVGQFVTDLDAATVGYAVLSLTVVRMGPVALSLVHSQAAPRTVAFAGWFGPRGLASIVFMLTIVEEANLPGTATIVQVVTVTVLFSVVAHGMTASPLTNRYVTWCDQRRTELAFESQEVDMSGMARRRWNRRAGTTRNRPRSD